MSFSLVAIGIFLLAYGLIVFVKSNFTLGIFLTLFLGLGMFAIGIFREKLKLITSQGFWKYVKIFIITALCFQFVLIGFLAIYGQNDNVNYEEDAVIVLGAAVHGDKVSLPLRYRLDKAIEYHFKNPDALIVVTGGKGYQESVTEAFAMKKYLIEHGVDEKIIFMEEKATSTIENMKYSKEILDKKLNSDYRTVVITNDFHIYRGVRYAKSAGFKYVSHMGASITWYNYIPCYLRESLAVLKMFVFD